MKTKRTVAAIDMGGTNIKACLFIQGEMQDFRETPSEANRGGVHLLSRAADLLNTMGSFDALGVSTAGQVEPESGIIQYANDNIPGYTGTDVGEFFRQRFSVPVDVRNDVCAAALGEGLRGAAQGASDYICLTYGTGIGGGVVLGGKLYYGDGFCAGPMLGGLILQPAAASSTADAFSGTYERLASAKALVQAVQAVEPTIKGGREIFSRLSEAPFRQVVEQWLDHVCAGLCTIIHTYNVPLVVLGGGIMEQTWVVEEVSRRTKSRLIPAFSETVIAGALLGNKAGLYGAASSFLPEYKNGIS